MSINVAATDDGCRISAHLANPSLKLSTAVTFEGVLISQTADKKQQATAATYLQDLSALRYACLSRLDSSAANTEIELLEAAEAYVSALLGLVNNYTQASNSAPELDEQTGSPSMPHADDSNAQAACMTAANCSALNWPRLLVFEF